MTRGIMAGVSMLFLVAGIFQCHMTVNASEHVKTLSSAKYTAEGNAFAATRGGISGIYRVGALQMLNLVGTDLTTGENELLNEEEESNEESDLTEADVQAEDSGIELMAAGDQIASGAAGENVTWTLTEKEDGTYELALGGTGAMTDYTAGAAPWRNYSTKITSVVIGEQVTSIGTYAFYLCGSLKEVVIPGTVQTVGTGAFCSCTSLEKVTVEDGAVRISTNAFIYAGSGTQLVIGSGTTIEAAAFSNFTGLTTAIVGGEGTSIGESAFYQCQKLTSVSIEDGVTSIGTSAFFYCSALKEVTIAGTVERIEEGAFIGCYRLEKITIEAGSVHVSKNAFASCGLENGMELIVQAGTVIEDEACSENTGLKKATISGEGTKIGNSAFYMCRNLTSLTIEDGVTEIGSSAFNGCMSLKEVTVPGTVQQIGEYAFAACYDLEEVVIEDGSVSIGAYAFNGSGVYAEAGTHLTVGSGAVIGNEAFRQFSGLTTAHIKKNVVSIGDFAFFNNEKLETVIIDENVKSIGDYAFYACGVLKSLSLGEGLKSIGVYAFAVCSALPEVTIPEGVTNIGQYAFGACTSLETVRIGTAPNQVVGPSAFVECTNLKNVEVFGTEGKLGDSAFSGISTITNVTVKSGVPAIGKYAFSRCYGIQNGDFVIEEPCALTAETLELSTIWFAHDSWVKILAPDLYELLPKNGTSQEPFDGEHTIEGYDDVRTGESNGSTWLYQAVRWLNDDKTEAELRTDVSFVSETGSGISGESKDYIFILDKSYAATEQILDTNSVMFGMTRRIRDGEFGDSRVAITSFNGNSMLGLEESADLNVFTEYWEGVSFGNGGGNSYDTAFATAYRIIQERTDQSRKPVIIFLSDEPPASTDTEYANTAKSLREGDGNVPPTEIYSVRYDISSYKWADWEQMDAALEEISGDNVFKADDGHSLASAYLECVGYAAGTRTRAKLTGTVNSDYFTVSDTAEITVQTLAGTVVSNTAVRIVKDPDTGKQTLEWDLSGLSCNTTYCLTISGLQVKQDQDGQYYEGDLPVCEGNTMILDMSEVQINTVSSPVLHRKNVVDPISLVIIPSRIDLEKTEGSSPAEAAAEATVTLSQKAEAGLAGDVRIFVTSAFQLTNQEGDTLLTQVYVDGKVYDESVPLAELNTAGVQRQLFEVRAMKNQEDPNTRGVYTGIMNFTVSYGE